MREFTLSTTICVAKTFSVSDYNSVEEFEADLKKCEEDNEYANNKLYDAMNNFDVCEFMEETDEIEVNEYDENGDLVDEEW